MDQPNDVELNKALTGASWAQLVNAESPNDVQMQLSDRINGQSRDSSLLDEARGGSTKIVPTQVRTDISPTSVFKKTQEDNCGGSDYSMEISDNEGNAYQCSSEKEFTTVRKGRDRSKKQRVGK